MLYLALSKSCWDCGYVLFIVESVIHEVMKDVQYTGIDDFNERIVSHPIFKGTSPTSHIGIRELWCKMFAAVAPDDSEQNAYFRTRIALTTNKAVSVKSVSTSKPSSAPGKQSSSSSTSAPLRVCKAQFLHDIGFCSASGAVFPPCTRVPCSYSYEAKEMAKCPADLEKFISVFEEASVISTKLASDLRVHVQPTKKRK